MPLFDATWSLFFASVLPDRRPRIRVIDSRREYKSSQVTREGLVTPPLAIDALSALSPISLDNLRDYQYSDVITPLDSTLCSV